MRLISASLKQQRGGRSMRHVAKEIGVSASVVCHAENRRRISHKSRRLISVWLSGERRRKAIEDHQKPLSALPVGSLVYSLPDGLITGSLPASPNFYAFNKTKAEKDRENANIQRRLDMMPMNSAPSAPPFVVIDPAVLAKIPELEKSPKFSKGGLVIVDDHESHLKKGDIHCLLFSYWVTIGLVALIASLAVWGW